MRFNRSSICAALMPLLAGCFAPAVPNDDLVQACRGEPAHWRDQIVMADTVLTADWVNLLAPQLRWTNTVGVQPGYNPCAACTSLLLRGFSTVEYLPTSAPSLDRVWRYTFANDGDPRCQFNEDRAAPINHPPAGKCLAVERDVPRSARYAIALHNTHRNDQGIDIWTYELVDLNERSVVARATEPTQTGWETIIYRCNDVSIERGDARDFVDQSIQPNALQ